MLARSKSSAVLSMLGLVGALALTSAAPAGAASTTVLETELGITVYAHDIDEEGTWSNGDEVFIKVVRNGVSQRFAPTDGTVDVNEDEEGKIVEFPSHYPLKFPLGEQVTIQVWEDDTSGDDLLAEAKDVVVQCNRPFSGVTEISKRKYYNYSFDAKFYAFGC
ncbi:hypothetical protein HS041_25370 [Planomonospora sp. ID67723]|uniref:hypothetical protein n=1 Tax=Planomonospora sp. ID67723 TaxID=2738134 RepID=UPI0018C44FFF|nr:hypothetical protein [Planomonospora sp. ID67723]MBG0831095.1 hypothetical protein [Planomonospora sp. ID67723]